MSGKNALPSLRFRKRTVIRYCDSEEQEGEEREKEHENKNDVIHVRIPLIFLWVKKIIQRKRSLKNHADTSSKILMLCSRAFKSAMRS